MKIDKKLLKAICKVQTVTGNTEQMAMFIFKYLESNQLEYYTDKHGNIYVNSFYENVPCMVAHIDTVHDIVEDLTVFESEDIWLAYNTDTMQPTGIGGDDKVGIYITLELLKKHRIKAAFFVDEEIGCAGSRNADMDFFKGVNYVLQCDRRGNSDFVNNISGKLSSKRFHKDVLPILNQYGYKFSNGMITDVGQLAENKIGVSVANMSCGYHNPHTASEYIVLSEILNCMNMCDTIFYQLDKKYEHKFITERYNYRSTGYYSGWDIDWKGTGITTKEKLFGTYNKSIPKLQHGAWNYETNEWEPDAVISWSWLSGFAYSNKYKAYAKISLPDEIEIDEEVNGNIVEF